MNWKLIFEEVDNNKNAQETLHLVNSIGDNICC